MDILNFIKEELLFEKKKTKKDACYHKVKSRYDVWPSAYASGALVKCRKVGATNWGKSKKESEEIDNHNLIVERKLTKKASSETNLGDWFKRKGAKGSSVSLGVKRPKKNLYLKVRFTTYLKRMILTHLVIHLVKREMRVN